MKRHHLQPETRALAAFVAAVLLAVIAAFLVLIPDVAVQSVDSMTRIPTHLDQLIPAALLP